eukprot:TRINITY_DN3401_c0_g1_i1.p1 TRINITY_DN3401_c0_g1~~TRINITY_DN3401_c0_g1_i1.p1  ORF type:complete len:181 (+),score=28.65 TRINITY_DN3401_c0_g1_i1:1-543(+)
MGVASPYLLKPLNPCSLLNEEQFDSLWRWFSPRIQIQEPTCAYFTGRDGFSFNHLLSACENFSPVVLIIRSFEGNIFGAYVNDRLCKKGDRYYGTGESFLFTLSPKITKYSWIPESNTYFILLESDIFAVGGGGGHGICVESDLLHGYSERCATFNNEPLNGGLVNFEIAQLEILAFHKY